jgi:hypothetical protein
LPGCSNKSEEPWPSEAKEGELNAQSKPSPDQNFQSESGTKNLGAESRRSTLQSSYADSIGRDAWPTFKAPTPPDQKTTHPLRVLIFSHPQKPFPYARLAGTAFA